MILIKIILQIFLNGHFKNMISFDDYKAPSNKQKSLKTLNNECLTVKTNVII